MPAQWYCRILDTEFGPLAFAELKELADSGTLGQHDLVRSSDSNQWESARGVPGLFDSTSASKPASRRLRPPLLSTGDAPACPADHGVPKVIDEHEGAPPETVAIEPQVANHDQPHPAPFRPPAARPRAPAPTAPPARTKPPGNWRRIGIAAAIFASLALALAVADRIQHRREMRFPPPIAERIRQPAGHFLWGWGPLSDAELVVVYVDIVVVGLAISYMGAAVFENQLSEHSTPARTRLGSRRRDGCQ